MPSTPMHSGEMEVNDQTLRAYPYPEHSRQYCRWTPKKPHAPRGEVYARDWSCKEASHGRRIWAGWNLLANQVVASQEHREKDVRGGRSRP